MRPLTLGSLEAMRVMGIAWLDETVQLDLEEEQRQLMLYHWLHTAPVEEVEHALWSGNWRAVQPAEVPDVIIARYRLHRARLIAEIKDVSVICRPKPEDKKRAETTPSDIVRPQSIDYRIYLLMRDTHMSRAEILWQLPLPQALTIYHCALWHAGHWTVRPGAPVDDKEFEDFELEGLDQEAEPSIDTTAES
jgi:hypothetical protein